jgi:integrase/recombinase XerD
MVPKFLIDECLSPDLAALARERGFFESSHSTAMALLQYGVDIAVIALWLGHESIETTNEYLHANMAIKEKALATLQPVGKKFRRFIAGDTLLEFLATL